MVSFESDYITGTHEKILDAFIKSNRVPQSGYGNDEYTRSAIDKIKKACDLPDASVFLLTGGTQTNQIVIDSMLRSYQGVISAETGHINCHEGGAVEYSGHKVLTLPQKEGKISAYDLEKYLSSFFADENRDHMVFPGMVYISYPTEYGTVYSKKELENIYEICRKYKIILFADGARLTYGLNCKDGMTLPEFARLCDVFYIGGTKAGGLCGEAVVFTKNNMPDHFVTLVKQHGGLLAKGRLTGITFDTLFTDGLYDDIGKYAVETAMKLREIFVKKGYRLFIDSPTNQQFMIIQKEKFAELKKKVAFELWEKYDEEYLVARFVTCWSTTSEDLSYLESLL